MQIGVLPSWMTVGKIRRKVALSNMIHGWMVRLIASEPFYAKLMNHSIGLML